MNNTVIPLRTRLLVEHMQQTSGQRLTIREKRDLRWIAGALFVSAALWALIILPWAL